MLHTGQTRLSGKMANKITGIKALYNMAKGADEVAPAAKVTPVAKQKALAEMGDDWGWKGGKPGEMTAGELTKTLDRTSGLNNRYSEKQYKARNKAIDEVYKHEDKFSAKYGKSPLSQQADFYGNGFIVDTLSALEKADVPRAWTGRLAAALPQNSFSLTLPDKAAYLSGISDAMRPMTNAQRETFVTLLPEWYGTIDELAAAARLL